MDAVCFSHLWWVNWLNVHRTQSDEAPTSLTYSTKQALCSFTLSDQGNREGGWQVMRSACWSFCCTSWDFFSENAFFFFFLIENVTFKIIVNQRYNYELSTGIDLFFNWEIFLSYFWKLSQLTFLAVYFTDLSERRHHLAVMHNIQLTFPIMHCVEQFVRFAECLYVQNINNYVGNCDFSPGL